MEEMERKKKMKKIDDLEKLRKKSVDQYGPSGMTEEVTQGYAELIQEEDRKNAMKKKPKGYKNGGLVTRGQGAVMRKKSCKSY